MSSGTLFVVATPIGHLHDLSPRAREVLSAVDLIAAEDTRHSRKLLQAFGLTTPLTSLHAHNEPQRVEGLIERLLHGQSIALISDAGTPLVSDPGFLLVRTALQAGLKVSPIPGPSAAMAALSVGGLPSERFVFEGFLPAKGAARRARLGELAHEIRTLIFYEAPHRLLASLKDMGDILGGEREATLARELSKTFETVRLDTLAGLAAWVAEDAEQQRGECVILVRGARPEASPQGAGIDARALLQTLLAHEVPVKTAAAVAAELLGGSKKAHYQLCLELRGAD